ncbi:MAG: crossover junction endodeoxyribonuclease RuvC [Planctomycetota bacterium]
MGIDPGLNLTGYGVIRVSGNEMRLVEAGVVRSKPSDRLENRIREIYDGVHEVLQQHNPTFLALEQLFSHYSRPKTAILMGHARGAICLAAAQQGVEVKSFEPTKVKKTMTGNGHAPKHQMQQAVRMQLGLREVPEPADIADALAIAICGFHFQHNPLLQQSQ